MNQEGASQLLPPLSSQSLAGVAYPEDDYVRNAYARHMIDARREYTEQQQREQAFVEHAFGQHVLDAEMARHDPLTRSSRGGQRDDEKRYGYVTRDSCGPL